MSLQFIHVQRRRSPTRGTSVGGPRLRASSRTQYLRTEDSQHQNRTVFHCRLYILNFEISKSLFLAPSCSFLKHLLRQPGFRESNEHSDIL